MGEDQHDIEQISQARNRKTKWAKLTADEHAAYAKILNRLSEIAEKARIALEPFGKFTIGLTSGFSLSSGVRGSLPKDLWFALFNEQNQDEFLYMPQLYMIVSERGIEHGFAAAIHPRDFSNTSFKEKLRVATPRIFSTFPEKHSSLVQVLSGRLEESGFWALRKKTRLEPGVNDFASLAELIDFIKSNEGREWGAAAICRYIRPASLDTPDADLGAEFEQTVKNFGSLMAQMTPANEPPVAPPTTSPDENGGIMRRCLEDFLARFPKIAPSQPFGIHAEIWPLMERLKLQGLLKTHALTSRPHIKVQWSVGVGNWARVLRWSRKIGQVAKVYSTD